MQNYDFHSSVTEVDRMVLRIEGNLSYYNVTGKRCYKTCKDEWKGFTYTCLREDGHDGVHAAFGSRPLFVWK